MEGSAIHQFFSREFKLLDIKVFVILPLLFLANVSRVIKYMRSRVYQLPHLAQELKEEFVVSYVPQ